jgi:hypothetical protein
MLRGSQELAPQDDGILDDSVYSICREPAMLQRVRDTMHTMGYSSAMSINREWTTP